MKQSQIRKLSEFLYAAGGSFRNSICIDCGECPQGCISLGILLTTDYSGSPLLIPVSVFEELTGAVVDKTECLTVMKRQVFEGLYSLLLTWTADSAKDCQLKQAICKEGWDMPCNT